MLGNENGMKILKFEIKQMKNADGSITMSEIKEWTNGEKQYKRVTISTVWETDIE